VGIVPKKLLRFGILEESDT